MKWVILSVVVVLLLLTFYFVYKSRNAQLTGIPTSEGLNPENLEGTVTNFLGVPWGGTMGYNTISGQI